MTFFKDLDTIMKQDFGNRGLLNELPDNPIQETLTALTLARRVILLTGFPVRLEDGSYVGETDGPLGTADIAAALTALGASVLVITDEPAFSIVSDVICCRAPKAKPPNSSEAASKPLNRPILFLWNAPERPPTATITACAVRFSMT